MGRFFVELFKRYLVLKLLYCKMFRLSYLILLFLFLTLDWHFPIILPFSDNYLETLAVSSSSAALLFQI